MNLTKDFSLEEMTNSQTAVRLGIGNTPNAEQIQNLTKLCVNVLQPLRDLLHDAIHVDSGYRSPQVNAAVGGVPSSQHLEGKAADTVCFMSTVDWANFIINSEIEFDQLILEFYSAEKGPHSGWVHVSYNEGNNRKQVLTATKNNQGHTIYLNGVVA